MVTHVDNKLDEADKDLDDIIADLNQGKNLMKEINVEIKIQQDKLNLIREDIKETYSMTKRTQKMINYFKRNLMTDKLLCAFLILIIIAVIIIIILKIMGFKNDSFNDVV